MKGINSELISEVRHRANIMEVVSETVVLKRAGKDYKGLCPFHNEKTPSFYVNPEKGIFKCFGCGEGGDVFSFVQKLKKVDFVDSVREIAHKVGVQIVERELENGEYDRRSHILMLYQQAAEYYHKLLLDPQEGAAAMSYLERRGLSYDTVLRFKLGYAPSVWDGLLRYLGSAGQSAMDTLVESGLIRRKPETGSCYDLFRNRLMVPIQDEQGRVIAFGGRTMADDQVKYLNSPESIIYTKGEHLFGLHQAKDEIKEKDSVIVVEGYFDAIAAHQFGFRNTVATLGTALTERQGKLLVRYTDSRLVYFCFDADAAGERAIERGTDVLGAIAEGIGIQMRSIQLPVGKDPDECLRSGDGGAAVFAAAIESAPMLIDYRLDRAVKFADLKSHTGRIDAAKLVVPILASIKNAVGRGEYIRQWALKLGIREEDLLTDVGQYRRQNRMTGSQNERTPWKAETFQDKTKKSARSGSHEAESQILALYLVSAEEYELVKEKLAGENLLEPVHQRIKEAAEGIGKFGTASEFLHRLQERLTTDEEAKRVLVDIILKSEEIQVQKMPTEIILKDYRARILQERLSQHLTKLRLMMNSPVPEEEQVNLSSKISHLIKLQDAFLKNARTEEEMDELRRRLDALMLETAREASSQQ